MALLNCCMEGVSAVPPSGRLSGAKGPSAGEFAYVKTKELLACLIDRRGSPALCPGNHSQSVGEYMRQYSWGN